MTLPTGAQLLTLFQHEIAPGTIFIDAVVGDFLRERTDAAVQWVTIVATVDVRSAIVVDIDQIRRQAQPRCAEPSAGAHEGELFHIAGQQGA